MVLNALWSGLARLFAALAMLAVAHAPMAAALHAGTGSTIECTEGGEAAAAEDHHPHPDDHDHHAHGCGTCHVHFIKPDDQPAPATPQQRADLFPACAGAAIAARPRELLRPPRA